MRPLILRASTDQRRRSSLQSDSLPPAVTAHLARVAAAAPGESSPTGRRRGSLLQESQRRNSLSDLHAPRKPPQPASSTVMRPRYSKATRQQQQRGQEDTRAADIRLAGLVWILLIVVLLVITVTAVSLLLRSWMS